MQGTWGLLPFEGDPGTRKQHVSGPGVGELGWQSLASLPDLPHMVLPSPPAIIDTPPNLSAH